MKALAKTSRTPKRAYNEFSNDSRIRYPVSLYLIEVEVTREGAGVEICCIGAESCREPQIPKNDEATPQFLLSEDLEDSLKELLSMQI